MRDETSLGYHDVCEQLKLLIGSTVQFSIYYCSLYGLPSELNGYLKYTVQAKYHEIKMNIKQQLGYKHSHS